MQGGYPRGMGMGFRGPNVGAFPIGQNPQMMNQGFAQNMRPQQMMVQPPNNLGMGNFVGYPVRISQPVGGQSSMMQGGGGGGGGSWGNSDNMRGPRPQMGAVLGYGAGRLPPNNSLLEGYMGGNSFSGSAGNSFGSGMNAPPVGGGSGGHDSHAAHGGGGGMHGSQSNFPRLGTPSSNPFDDFFNKPFQFQASKQNPPLPPPPPPPSTQNNSDGRDNLAPNAFPNVSQNNYGNHRPPPPPPNTHGNHRPPLPPPNTHGNHRPPPPPPNTQSNGSGMNNPMAHSFPNAAPNNNGIPRPPTSTYLRPPPPPPPIVLSTANQPSGVKAIDYDHGRQQFQNDEVDQALSEILNYPGTGPIKSSASSLPPPNILPPRASQDPEDAYDAYGANIERKFMQDREREERRKRALPIPRTLLDEDSGRRDVDRDRPRSSSSSSSRRSRSPPPSSGGGRRGTPASGTSSAKSTPPPAAPPAPPPKAETVAIDDILCDPGRKRRPRNIAILIRGAPGSGKSHLAKLIKEKEHAESSSGGTAPRILSIDDFFCTDVEKMEKNPKTGKMTKVTKLVYEYEEAMEPSYYKSLLKMFKKNVEQGFYPFLIVDAVFQKLAEFEEYWSFAKSKGYQVYVVELVVEAAVCAKRNIHERTLAELTKICSNWVKTPDHMINLDVRTLLQDDAIQEVEMEDVLDEEPSSSAIATENVEGQDDAKDHQGSGNEGEEEEDDNNVEGFRKVIRSKWDGDVSETNLDLLDGLSIRRRRESSGGGENELKISMQDFLEAEMHKKPKNDGKKRVRWADIEEMKEQERAQAIGFVVGQSKKDWERMTEAGAKDAQSALKRTRFIPHRDDDKEVVLQ